MQELANFCSDSVAIWILIGKVIEVFKIVIPIIIVLLCLIDLGKAVVASDDKEIKQAQKMVIRRIVYGIVLFFVVVIVQTVFNLVGERTNDTACFKCVKDPTSCEIQDKENNDKEENNKQEQVA